MGQKDFNQFLDNYLTAKRKKQKLLSKDNQLFSFLKKEKPATVSEKFPELDGTQVHVIEKEKGLIDRLIARFTAERKEELGDIDPALVEEQLIEKELGESEFEAVEEEMEQEIEDSPTFGDRVKGFFHKLFGKDHVEVEDEYETTTYEYETPVETAIKSEDVPAQIEEPEEEVYVQRSSIFDSIKSMFGKREVEETEFTEEANTVSEEKHAELEADLKEIAKFSVSIMKNLPKRKLDDLKESDKFVQYKEILRKRNLIKE